MWIGKDNTGRFRERPFYQRREIEGLVSTTLSAFTKAAGRIIKYPLDDEALTVLIESSTEAFDPYKDMSDVGIDVDGYTIFSRVGKPTVLINQDLSEDRYRLRRRMTLAHEFGHVVLHQVLYERDDRQLDLLVSTELVPVYCVRTATPPFVDWCEWQASFFAGALLMPTDVVSAKLYERDPDLTKPQPEGSIGAQRVATVLAELFDVSKEAARVRLSQLGLIVVSGTRSMIKETGT